MKKVSELWKKMRIKTKIIFAYLTLLMLSFLITFFVMYTINSSYTKKEIGNVGAQTVRALKGNLFLIFDNVTQFSDMVYFDNQVQESLRNVNTTSMDPEIYRTIRKSLINMILSADYISGVYIRDNYGNFYSSYTNAPERVMSEQIPETNWFRELPSYNGNGHFIHGSEGIIQYFGNTDYITYIREIRDKNTYEPLAVLMVTVNEETIQSYFDEVGTPYDSNFFILNEKDQYVVKPKENEEIITEFIRSGEDLGDEEYCVANLEKKQVFTVCQDMGIQNWRLVGIFQADNAKVLVPYYSTVIVLVICINVLFVFLGSMMLTKFIFHPLSKVENHMLLVEQGQFVKMESDNEKNEISNLKRVYNHMIKAIQELIVQVKEEEKIIAKGELDLLQAQINPHFLYNTLDAVSALALMKDFDNCFRMTQALGSFYRNSLNSGRNFISIEDEIACIKSYLTILNIRYEDKIEVKYEVEEGLQNCQVIKLLLQPLVENAVHHGIKGKQEHGTIWIRVFSNEDEVVFLVSDDGVGMSEERIQEIMEGRTVTGKSGFGIHSLIQRISLYYGIEHPVMIHSEIGNGTEVAVRVKRVAGGEEYGDKIESSSCR